VLREKVTFAPDMDVFLHGLLSLVRQTRLQTVKRNIVLGITGQFMLVEKIHTLAVFVLDHRQSSQMAALKVE
jgi:hypothetical protein